MSFSTILLFLHVLAGCLLLGHALLVPHLRGSLRRAKSPAVVGNCAELMRRASQLNPVFAMVLLATGVALGGWSVLSDMWLLLPLAAWLVNSLLAALVVRPLGVGIGRTVAQGPDAEVTPELDALRWAPRMDVAENIMAANDLASLFVMIEKPEMASTIVAFLIAQLAVFLAWGLGRRTSAPALARIPQN